MLYVTAELYRQLMDPRPNAAETERWAKLEASLSHFVEGGVVDPGYIKPLEHRPARYEWEILSRRPRPGLRVLGRFAAVDVFIGTNAVVRKEQGRKESRAWRDTVVTCTTTWRRLFPSHEPLESRNIHDCVSDRAYTAGELGS